MSNADLQISQLQAQLEEKERDLGEALEYKYRVDTITSMWNASKQRVEALRIENNELKEQLQQYEEQTSSTSQPVTSAAAQPSFDSNKGFEVVIFYMSLY